MTSSTDRAPATNRRANASGTFGTLADSGIGFELRRQSSYLLPSKQLPEFQPTARGVLPNGDNGSPVEKQPRPNWETAICALISGLVKCPQNDLPIRKVIQDTRKAVVGSRVRPGRDIGIGKVVVEAQKSRVNGWPLPNFETARPRREVADIDRYAIGRRRAEGVSL